MIIAVENEPYPESPIGKSCAIKLNDWLDLARVLKDRVELDVRPVDELGSASPDIVEAFTTRAGLLSGETFPTKGEHDYVNDMRAYWPYVEQSGIPAIPVYEEGILPDRYPVFARGREASFTKCKIASREELAGLDESDLVLRPYVHIEPCWTRASVRKELRVHVVCRKAVCVEFLFPVWASAHPTADEFAAGCQWTKAAAPRVVEWAECLGGNVPCRWFSADFAETKELGTCLIELNPGWCAGVANCCCARAIHAAILRSAFGVSICEEVLLTSSQSVPYVRGI